MLLVYCILILIPKIHLTDSIITLQISQFQKQTYMKMPMVCVKIFHVQCLCFCREVVHLQKLPLAWEEIYLTLDQEGVKKMDRVENQVREREQYETYFLTYEKIQNAYQA